MPPTARLPVFVHSLFLGNLLSFGSKQERLELGPLNLIIGANGGGKSNLLEAVRLMRAAPKEMGDVTRQGGGIDEWIF